MSKKRKTINPQPWRLPYGQRVVVTGAINNGMLPIGTRGTIVELKVDPVKVGSPTVVSHMGNENDYFWEHWEEQFVHVDAREGRPIQMRRWHIAPIDEWVPGGAR